VSRLTLEQWAAIVTALVVLNCAVFLVVAFMIFGAQPPSPEPTSVVVVLATDTPGASSTAPPRPTFTPSETFMPPSRTPSPAATITLTPGPTPTDTSTLTPSPTATFTVSPTPSPTFTPTPTFTPSLTPTDTPTATPTSTPTPTATASPSHTATPTVALFSLGPPRDLYVEVVGHYALTLRWQPPPGAWEANDLRYRLAWWPSGQWIVTPATTYQVEKLMPGSQYTFLIVAMEGAHVSAGYSVNVATLPLQTSPPAAAPRPPSPTPLPAGVVPLSLMSHQSYKDNLGDLHVVGEVRNDLAIAVEAIEIRAIFYDPADEPILERAVESLVPLLAPGERAPFRVVLSPAGDAVAYSLQVMARASTQSPLPGPAVVESQAEQDRAGFYRVTAQVVNSTERAIMGARAVVTLYNQGGQVVNVGTAYITPLQLEPDEMGRFDCIFEYFPNVVAYTVRTTSY
jgi:hypothetical protein